MWVNRLPFAAAEPPQRQQRHERFSCQNGNVHAVRYCRSVERKPDGKRYFNNPESSEHEPRGSQCVAGRIDAVEHHGAKSVHRHAIAHHAQTARSGFDDSRFIDEQSNYKSWK